MLVGSGFFFFNDTATTEIYTLSLHDALPISWPRERGCGSPSASPSWPRSSSRRSPVRRGPRTDRHEPRLIPGMGQRGVLSRAPGRAPAAVGSWAGRRRAELALGYRSCEPAHIEPHWTA